MSDTETTAVKLNSGGVLQDVPHQQSVITFLRILRVFAMISIVAGHWCSYAGIYLYDLGGLGVHVFLLISGYLCGLRVVHSPKKWLSKRFFRIMKPVWIWTVFIACVYCVVGGLNAGLITSMLGLNGLSWVIPITLPQTSGMTHTWYVTVILLCYLLVPILQRIQWSNNKQSLVLFLVLMLLQVLLVKFNVQLVFFIQFMIGYYLSATNKKIGIKSIFVSDTIMMIVCILRVFAHMCSVSEAFYGGVIAEWSENTIALFIFFIFDFGCSKWKTISERLSNNAVVACLDKLSYPIYITHYAFLFGVLSVSKLNASILLQFQIFAAGILISAFMVMKIDTKVHIRKRTV